MTADAVGTMSRLGDVVYLSGILYTAREGVYRRVVLEVDRLGPFLVEGDREGRSLFAVANREIDGRLAEIYRQLPPYVMGRFGETTSRHDEVV